MLFCQICEFFKNTFRFYREGKVEQHIMGTKAVLKSMGFIIHDEKPVLDPTQKPKHIGFAFDFVSMTTSLTEKKNDKKN